MCFQESNIAKKPPRSQSIAVAGATAGVCTSPRSRQQWLWVSQRGKPRRRGDASVVSAPLITRASLSDVTLHIKGNRRGYSRRLLIVFKALHYQTTSIQHWDVQEVIQPGPGVAATHPALQMQFRFIRKAQRVSERGQGNMNTSSSTRPQ